MDLKTTYRRETKGLIFKSTYHIVETTIKFTEAEEQTILENGLMDMLLWERGTPADEKDADKDYSFRLKPDLFLSFGKDSYAFATETEARQYEAIVKGPIKETLEETLAEAMKR